MTLTDDMVAFVVTATPPEAALTLAVDHLDAMGAALRRDGEAVAARASGWIAHCDEPRRGAWPSARCALDTAGWPVITATVLALQQDSRDRAEGGGCARRRHRGSRVGGRGALTAATVAERWSARGIAGLIGAGVAAARLLGLDEAGVRNVVGLCATQAAGLRAARAPKPVWCRPPRPRRTPWRPRPWPVTDSRPRPTVLAAAEDCSRCWLPARRRSPTSSGRGPRNSTMTQTDSVNTGPAPAVEESEPGRRRSALSTSPIAQAGLGAAAAVFGVVALSTRPGLPCSARRAYPAPASSRSPCRSR